MRAGVIVAGGRSTRFEGGDKATADLAGTPMVRRVADRLVSVGELVVNCRPDQREAIAAALDGVSPSPAFAEDEVPDRGPVAGMAAGLAAVDAEYAAVVACDMPFLDPDLLEVLFERAAGTDGAVPRVEGHRQPLQAVYRTEAALAACQAVLGRGEGSLGAVLDTLEPAILGPEEVRRHADPGSFRNLNTRAALEAATAAFEE